MCAKFTVPLVDLRFTGRGGEGGGGGSVSSPSLELNRKHVGYMWGDLQARVPLPPRGCAKIYKSDSMPRLSSSRPVSSGWAPLGAEAGGSCRPRPRRRRCRCSGSPTRSCRRPGCRSTKKMYYVGFSPVFRWWFRCCLPGLDVLRHHAPRQVVIAVVSSRVVKEIRPGGEDVTGQPGATLRVSKKRK